jgi:hypothetical protein
VSTALLPAPLKTVASALRLIGILDGAERVGMTPLRLETLHSIAYFTDALVGWSAMGPVAGRGGWPVVVLVSLGVGDRHGFSSVFGRRSVFGGC